jgi:hypothetical protein
MRTINVIDIVRYWYTIEENGVTLSKLFLNGNPLEYGGEQIKGLEDEYQTSKKFAETRIPAGLYKIGITMSNRFKKELIEVFDVPDFTGIRCHSGNTELHTEGCLLVGNRVGKLDGKTAVLNSKDTHNYLQETIIRPLLSTGDVYFNYIDFDLSK